MKICRRQFSLYFLLAGILPLPPLFAADSDADHAYFREKIEPLLAQNCYECHSHETGKAKGGLVLDFAAGWKEGGSSGPALVPGKPEDSLLVEMIHSTDPDLRMPPEKPLSAEQRELLTAWVKKGAPDPRRADLASVEEIDEAATTHWAFQPVRKPEPPKLTKLEEHAISSIDRFLLAAMEEAGIEPLPATDKATLLRRVTFDLIGLPPTPEELDAFLADSSENALAKVVDRLLDSPHYGERWGRHWLDVVRYADTAGDAGDFPVPMAWRYRNWVIDAVNADMPYDDFIRRQIAGDLMKADSPEERDANRIATGYLAISKRFGQNPRQMYLTRDDTIDNITKGLMGLTVSCARCHDHKFDPIPHEDYYALYGIFESTVYTFPGLEHERDSKDYVVLGGQEEEQLWAAHVAELEQLGEEIEKLKKNKALSDKEKKAKEKALTDSHSKLKSTPPPVRLAYAASEGEPTNTSLRLKGDFETTEQGSEVPRGFLEILGGQTLPDDCDDSGRLHLADWITAEDNPLTARVMVNRLWLHHFGSPLVTTPDDFGTRSQPPVHPELLDYLASRFVESGWSLKAMHRLLILSSAYQRAADGPEALVAKNEASDGANQHHWRFDSRRLSAEEFRDSLLLLGGTLDKAPGQEHPFSDKLHFRYSQHNPFKELYPTTKRTVYMMQPRQDKHPFMRVFDGPDTNVTVGERPVSVSAMQALYLMNSELAAEQAEGFARTLYENAADEDERLTLAYRTAFARPPSEEERKASRTFLAQAREAWRAEGLEASASDEGAWTSLAKVLLSSNEFMFVR